MLWWRLAIWVWGSRAVPSIFLNPGEVINPISGNAGILEVGLYPRGVDELAREVTLTFKKAGFAGGVNEWVMKAKAAKFLRNLSNSIEAITDRRGGGEGGEVFMEAARTEAIVVFMLTYFFLMFFLFPPLLQPIFACTLCLHRCRNLGLPDLCIFAYLLLHTLFSDGYPFPTQSL